MLFTCPGICYEQGQQKMRNQNSSQKGHANHMIVIMFHWGPILAKKAEKYTTINAVLCGAITSDHARFVAMCGKRLQVDIEQFL